MKSPAVSARPTAPAGISSADAPALDLPARFMALGMLGLLALALSGPWTLPLLLGKVYDHRLVAFVHLNTLGVIGAMIIGASYQLVPVVLQTPLASVRAARLSFWLYLGGLVALLAGFVWSWPPVLALGGTLLTLGFGLYVGVIAVTQRRALDRGVAAWHVAVGLVNVTAAVALAVLLAFNESGRFLGPLGQRLLAAHVTLMLGGWVGVTFFGVAYRLIGMFTLAEDRLWVPGAWLGLGLTTLGTWVLAVSLAAGLGEAGSLVGAFGLLAGFGLFEWQIVHLYAGRRRRGPDVHIPYVLAGSTFGLIATGLLLLGLAQGLGPRSPLWVAVGWLAIAGLAETVIQGFFYKIATFLVWLRRYAPVAGRQRVPKLEELYGQRIALLGWGLWSLGIALSTGAVALASVGLIYVGVGFLGAGLACFLANVVRIGSHWWRPVAPVGGARSPGGAQALRRSHREVAGP